MVMVSGSSPHKTDSDEDSISDFIEVSKGTNPNKNDTDGDGLSDLDESNTGIFVSLNDTGTDPVKSDTDGDGALEDFLSFLVFTIGMLLAKTRYQKEVILLHFQIYSNGKVQLNLLEV